MQQWTNVETSLPPPDGQVVPSRPEEISARWLTACLRHAGALPQDARVASFESTRIGQGRGFAGQLARIQLRYDPEQADAPATLIGKFAAQHGPTREMMSGMDAYVREVRFYRELAPEIGVGTARCYLAHFDPERGNFCLLLEDLAPSRSVDIETGLSLEQAEQVLTQLAGMHGRWWNRVAEVPWLELSEDVVNRLRARFLALLPSFVSQFGAIYPAMTGVAQQLGELMAGNEVMGALREPPMTLAHNDLHLENVFFPSEAGGRFALIDWQGLAGTRHGTTDVTRILCVGMRPELRRRHGDALLRHYHRKLRELGVRGFSLRKLRRRFREETTAMVVIGVLAMGTLDFNVEGGQRMAELLAGRIEVAVADSRVSALLRVVLWVVRLRRFARRLLVRARLLKS